MCEITLAVEALLTIPLLPQCSNNKSGWPGDESWILARVD